MNLQASHSVSASTKN